MRCMHPPTGLPSCISFKRHFTALHLEFSHSSTSSLPQNARSHTKKKFQSILATLFENQKGNTSDSNSHGKMSEAPKEVACRTTSGPIRRSAGRRSANQWPFRGRERGGSTETLSEVACDAEHGVRPSKLTKSRRARPVEPVGEVPHKAVISAAQPESLLGRNLATEWDDDVWELLGDDQQSEEE